MKTAKDKVIILFTCVPSRLIINLYLHSSSSVLFLMLTLMNMHEHRHRTRPAGGVVSDPIGFKCVTSLHTCFSLPANDSFCFGFAAT